MCHETLETWHDCACRKQTIKLCNAFLDSATDEGFAETKVYFERCGKREGVRKKRRGQCGMVDFLGGVGEGEDGAGAGNVLGEPAEVDLGDGDVMGHEDESADWKSEGVNGTSFHRVAW